LIRLCLISGFVIVADQITKALVIGFLPLHASVTVIPDFFDLTHILNSGGAFGLLAGQNPVVRKFFFLFVSSAVSCLILWFYIKTEKKSFILSSGFASVFGGAVGNLIDRFRFGRVVDFLYFHIGHYYWPAFNIADSAICIGMAVFLYYTVSRKLPDL